ncbi:biotin synthase [Schlegelella sp. ID0723]|uniref:Biotin synthase n=2 Tax=Piscinibacter koreensis TaxID=2742824 RepID=A0A7Y6NPV3_9BURK|nr:biotin synthase [Schlegelella koreensis]
MGERLQVIRLKPQRIVDWWGGLGASAEVLASAYPDAQRVAVEPTPEWLARARRAQVRPWWKPNLRRSGPQACAENEVAGPAQLVWANLVLHAVEDPPALFARWHALLAVDGFAMFSCLGPATLQTLRELYAELGWGAPTLGFIDMHDLGDMMVEAGFADPVLDQETLTIRWASSERLLSDLRALGGNVAPDRFAGLRTPRWRARLADALEQRRDGDGAITLAFEVAYGHGFKGAPRLAAGAPTTVSLDDMRAMVRAGRR